MRGDGGAGLGFLVGLKAEARMVRAAFPAARIAVSGATVTGARAGAERLVASGVRGLVSFGLAAGLDPAMPAGTIIVPSAVSFGDGRVVPVDAGLQHELGGGGGTLLHSDTVVRTAQEKAALFASTGCGALDMESGFVAGAARESGVPYAVLRVICDPAGRSLPEAAVLALDPQGGLRIGALLARLLRAPGEIGGMIQLGREAARARAAMAVYLRG